MKSLKLKTKSEQETISLGEFLGQLLTSHKVIRLNGQLGSGKTTFSQGIAKGLGVKEIVTSPTFTIAKCYFSSKIPFYHIDAYRLEGVTQEIGLEELIEGDGVCIVEWSNFIEDLFCNVSTIQIHIKRIDDDTREFEITYGEEDQILFEEVFVKWQNS